MYINKSLSTAPFRKYVKILHYKNMIAIIKSRVSRTFKPV